MADIYKILETLMETFAVTQKELSNATNIPHSTINRLKAGYSDDPRLSTLKPLASYFNITLGQLVGIEPLPKKLSEVVNKRRYIKIPLLPIKQASEWKKKSIEKNENNWADWIYTDQSISEYGYAIKIETNSYKEYFPKHSKLIIEPSLYQPIDGDIVLIKTQKNDLPTLYKYGVDGGVIIITPIHAHNNIVVQYEARTCIFCGIILGAQISYSESSGKKEININESF